MPGARAVYAMNDFVCRSARSIHSWWRSLRGCPPTASLAGRTSRITWLSWTSLCALCPPLPRCDACYIPQSHFWIASRAGGLLHGLMLRAVGRVCMINLPVLGGLFARYLHKTIKL